MNIIKTGITIIATLLISLTAAAEYTLFSVSGKGVQITRGKEKMVTKTGMLLKPTDIVTLADGSEIKISDKDKNEVYVMAVKGSYDVDRIITTAKERSCSKGEALGKTVVIMKKNKSKDHSQTGRTKRGTHTDKAVLSADTLRMYEWRE